MWSCVKICVMLCYFKKAAWREEIEPSFFKKTLPFNGRKGQVISHTSHLLCVMWAVMYFYHRHILNVLLYNLTYLGYFVCNLSSSYLIVIDRCG